MKRGSIKTQDCSFIGFWLPKALVKLIDDGVKQTDSDRSKFIRSAVREKLAAKNLRAAGASK
jgi:metal-responsive CopG/Arc/MetJ family transcriptional regulator